MRDPIATLLYENLLRKPWVTAPFYGPVEITRFGDVIPPAGMRIAPVLRNDVGPAFTLATDLSERTLP